MPATTEQLRDYLLAVLACEGDEAAERRLGLRDQWRKTHGTGADQSPAAAGDRAAEWTAIEQIWERFDSLPVDAAAELKPWLESNWQEVRAAAARVVQVRKLREPLAALWPKSLDQSLFVWWLSTLIRPAARRQALQQSLGQTLAATPATATAFQRFVRVVQKKFPELDAANLVAEAKAAERPVFAAVKPVVQPATDKGSNSNRTTLIWVAIAVIFPILRLAVSTTTTDKPSSTPPPRAGQTGVPWMVPHAQRTEEQERIYQSLQQALRGHGQPGNPPSLDPNDPLTQAAIRNTEMITGKKPTATPSGAPITDEERRRQAALNRLVTPDGRVLKQPLEPGANAPGFDNDDGLARIVRNAQQKVDAQTQQQTSERLAKLARMREIYENLLAQPKIDPAMLARKQQEMAEIIGYFKGRSDAKLFAEEAQKITQEFLDKSKQRLKPKPPAPAAPTDASPAVAPYAERLQRIREILERQANRRPGDGGDLKQELTELGALISSSSVGPGGKEFRAEVQKLLENFREQARLNAEGRAAPADAARPANAGARKGSP